MGIRAALTLKVGDTAANTRRLPSDGIVHLGRAMTWGLSRERGWVPRELLQLEPVESGWRAYIGTADVRLRGPAIRRADCEPGGTVLLERGSWTLSWSLNKRLETTVLVTDRLPAELNKVALAPAEPLHLPSTGTLLAGSRESLNNQQRARMAVLFRHLLENESAPHNLCASAADGLGMDERVLRSYANKLRLRINRDRQDELPDLPSLGEYLVHYSRAITRSDLPQSRRS